MAAASSATTSDREIAATRVFDAPRELVWRMWTDPRHVIHWWGPNGFTNTIHKMDVRPGGEWHFIMHGPDGRDYMNKIVYHDVIAPSRLQYSHISGPLFDVDVDFIDLGGEKTEVRMRMLFESAELRNRVVEEYGAVEGLKQTMAKLQATLQRSLVLERTFDAPRELVFRAWTDPAHVERWWGPHGFTNPRCEWDARPGGRIHIDMRGPDGTIYPMPGEFHEVVAPERLVFSSSAVDGALQVVTTVTFADAGEKTKMRMEAIVVHVAPEASFALQGMAEGWKQTLEKLDADLEETFLISRTFDAPRDLVWKAWTEEERLLQWFGPKGMPLTHAKLDLRPGGTFHYAMRMPNGEEMWGKWVFREIVPPERIVLVNSFSDSEGGITRHPMAPTWPAEMLTKTTFTERDGKTTVTIEWRPLNASTEERNTFVAGKPGMTQGWSGTFEQLDEYLARTA
jgi:uncharacterized protein YndB with AHSA1/START domain